MDAVVETQVPPVAPVVTPPTEQVEAPKELTIKEHAESTGADKRRRPIDEARPEEREEIATLTKRLREAEEASGIKRNPKESNRVYDLRMRAELAERLRDAAKPVEKPVERPIEARRAPEPIGDFTDPEPTLEQFKDEADPASAWLKAWNRWDRKAADHEAQKTAQTQQQTEHTEAIRKWFNERAQEHATRLSEFVAANPAAKAKLEAIGDKPLSPVLFAAIQIHPESQKLMMALADNPDLHDELFLLTDGKPINDPTRNPLVGIVQRRLLAKAQTVHAPERSPKPAWTPPTAPPTPVRTQPTATAASAPDKDAGDSIMAHARKYHRRDDD